MAQAQAAQLPPRHYEVVYILRPDVTKEAAERVAQRVEEVVGRQNGKLTLVESWGRRRLAYDIQHSKRGVYVYINYLGNGALVSELERNFRMLDEVMRFQTVKLGEQAEDIQIDEERVKFEAIEPLPEGEEDEWSLEQELGLVQAPRPQKAAEPSESSEGEEKSAKASSGSSSKPDASTSSKPDDSGSSSKPDASTSSKPDDSGSSSKPDDSGSSKQDDKQEEEEE